MALARVLVVDDDDVFRFALGKALRRMDFEVQEAANGQAALEHLTRAQPPELALLDLRMEGMSGLDVLRRRGSTPTRIVVLTGHGTVQAAVEAMQLGAFSFLEKPVDAEVLEPLLHQALAEKRQSTDGSSESWAPPLIGESAPMREVRKFIQTVAPTDETVALYGETGTGKEVVARQVHMASPRRNGPFIALNAACVPRELFESELFGHRKGAFTGATAEHKGLFREAHEGTLFIDELAELPIDSQAKLLRALETRSIRPIGESSEVPVDVRIVAATNRDLWNEAREGRFREDLYFRLQVFPLQIPPLRARPEDIVPIAEHLLVRIDSHCALTADAKRSIEQYDWPGNVRELLNVLRRASLFAESGTIDANLARKMLAASVFGHTGRTSQREAGALPSAPGSSLAHVEQAHITSVLAEKGGNITRAATALGIDRRTLQRKLRSYGMSVEDN